MTGKTVEVALTRFTGDKREATCGTVVRELPFTINLNGQELVTTLCSPADLEYLVAGILFSEGIIQRKDDIISIAIDGIVGLADVKTSPSATMNKPAFKPLVASGGGKGISSYTTRSIEKYKVHSDTRVKPTHVLSLIIFYGTRMFIGLLTACIVPPCAMRIKSSFSTMTSAGIMPWIRYSASAFCRISLRLARSLSPAGAYPPKSCLKWLNAIFPFSYLKHLPLTWE
jgi:hypothetical protein